MQRKRWRSARCMRKEKKTIMQTRDIQNFEESRTKARAYFCYLFSKNLPNRLPSISVESIMERMQKIKGDLKDCEGIYLLDEKGVQVTPTFSKTGQIDADAGLIRAERAYYYRAMREKRCTITDPYPSLITQELTVTASQPIFNEKGEICFVACLDMPLDTVLQIAHPMASGALFGKVSRYAYSAFSLALAMVALLLFVKGIEQFFIHGLHFHIIDIKEIFEATILLTLALAIFDLVKTLFEEEVLGQHRRGSSFDPHKTMVRFLGSIIIALSIEALMLVFKFAMTEPEMLINAIYIIGGVAMLMVGLAVYIKFTKKSSEE
jgi:hypothetical protein